MRGRMPRKRKAAPPDELAKLPTFKKAAALVAELRKAGGPRNRNVPEVVQAGVAALLVDARKAGQPVARALKALELGTGPYQWPGVRKALGAVKPGRGGRKLGSRNAAAFRPVRVAARGAHRNGAGPGLVVTTPQGYQIEGTVAEVAALLKTLGG